MTAHERLPTVYRLIALGTAVTIVGFFGPWVPHKAVALTVTGFELAEFAKLFPQVQGKTVPVFRELLLAPVVGGALLLGTWVNTRSRRPFTRLALTALAALLALAALPPYQFLTAPEYRRQLVMATAGALLILLAPLTVRVGCRARGAVIAFLALAGALTMGWQFAVFRPLVVALYNRPIGSGWGLLVYVVGSASVVVLGVLTAMGRDVSDAQRQRRRYG